MVFLQLYRRKFEVKRYHGDKMEENLGLSEKLSPATNKVRSIIDCTNIYATYPGLSETEKVLAV